jgi:hypothetical protein
LALCLMASGCGKFQQARECESFVSTVNAWIGAAPHPPASGGSAELIAKDVRATALSYDALSSKLDGLGIQGEELRPRVQRYRNIAKNASQALRAVADALDRSDAETARKKRVEFDDIARGEGPLVDEINRICGAR